MLPSRLFLVSVAHVQWQPGPRQKMAAGQDKVYEQVEDRKRKKGAARPPDEMVGETLKSLAEWRYLKTAHVGKNRWCVIFMRSTMCLVCCAISLPCHV